MIIVLADAGMLWRIKVKSFYLLNVKNTNVIEFVKLSSNG